ncbi:MAG: carbohydrate porin [Moorea sp. SIO1G6]|uniref:iron uptake porin n=1 Tax=Moorena sp. SIO1G6 TaxID=2607840 RepID=UPI0013C0DC31|nr:iron uptake porin [Moorena sp. SIO1G6]NET63876.1 carbohydrate porin [Moorena sp. SIO1G6]
MFNLIATAILTQGQIANQPAPQLQLAQQKVWDVSTPPMPELMEQVTPVHQLRVQPTVEVTTEDNQQRCPIQQSELCSRLNPLEYRLSDLETQQFSPTAVLSGEVLLGISSAFGKDVDDSVVFQGSVELKFNISFTGEDNLEVALEKGNSVDFSFTDEVTSEGRLGFFGDTEGGRLELSELSYEFPVSDQASIFISVSGDDLSDFNPFLEDSKDGAISEFGAENPIHNLVEDAGIEVRYDFNDALSVGVGYYSGEAENPDAGAGLFNGNLSGFVQLEFEPSERFLLGFTYVYNYNDSGLETDTGSVRSQVNLDRPVVGNSFGIAASFVPDPRVAVGGWVGLTKATVIDLGEANIWNYALTLAFADLGQEGNLLGIVIGQEPRLTGTSGFLIDDQQRDPDTSWHIEVFYKNQVSEQISITPGLIWITAPNHDNSNPDLFVFAVRTAFEF